ncbi:PDR/VanB family oxidoreductase [Micromonospora sp. NBC_01813]|uniref:PDR/VanB family oxidoreductase n=1 Tax=Micromonospora sp. NBC_01813 TaxID=2975988 RepID=UPI002DD831CB|nr:PDR/VanB family oxidoreductase [Micromonospora sp. NBC_01813]WSA10186.1 PDR/VanB family oxidoreductase [Micromonospora sp. NBC_01813]
MTATGGAGLAVVVAHREQAASGVIVLSLCLPDGGDLPEWSPGAHLDLELGPGLVRPYSLCGDPADRSSLRIAVQLEPDGRGGSRQVHERLSPGSAIRIRGPRNNFPLVEAPRYLFIAGGIGITPIRPMIDAVDAAGSDWQLVYGGRSRATMAFADALREKYGDRVSLCPQDETGLLDLTVLSTRPGRGLVYCCGPEPLIEAVRQRCQQWPAGSLHVERFTPAAEVGGAETAVEVELALSGRTVTVPPGVSILQAVEQAGVQVLSSCREGTCGTCETTVLDGVPEHRDSLLTAEEQAVGDTMLICVSRSRTPRLVLEL